MKASYSKKLKFLERTQVFDRIGARTNSIRTVGCRLRANFVAPGRWIYQALDTGQVRERPDDDVHDFNGCASIACQKDGDVREGWCEIVLNFVIVSVLALHIPASLIDPLDIHLTPYAFVALGHILIISLYIALN